MVTLRGEMPAPGGRQTVELDTAIGVRDAPFRFQQSAQFETMQRRIERAFSIFKLSPEVVWSYSVVAYPCDLRVRETALRIRISSVPGIRSGAGEDRDGAFF